LWHLRVDNTGVVSSHIWIKGACKCHLMSKKSADDDDDDDDSLAAANESQDLY
jgi:hypothetical protein